MSATLISPILDLPADQFRQHALDIFACKHCLKLCYLDRTGLCSKCYRNPSIRCRYPARETVSLITTANPVALRVYFPLAPTPTHYLPGTVEKMLVMRLRVEAGYAALHPDDAVREVESIG